MPGYEVFGEEEKKEIADVLATGVLFRYGFEDQRKGIFKVREFEEKFAAYTGAKHAVAVTSGSTALKVALVGLGVGPGDEVITQGFTFVATWEAILDVGAIPVFTEIDETLNMDPADLRKKITSKTKCIIPVHMMGAPARIEEIVSIANEFKIPVLEDTAQAAGARINGKHLGSFGACGTFSFDSVKTMTTGEGGMVITSDPELCRNFSEYHDHGHDHLDNPGGRGGEKRRFVGFNYRMMELQGAMGIAQLAKLDAMVASQKGYKAQMMDAAAAIPGVSFRELIDPAGESATFFAFMLSDADQCNKVNAHLRSKGVGAVNWSENGWHYFPNWEHLLESKTLRTSGWPFVDPENGKRRIFYDPESLPQTASLLQRTLVYQVPVRMSDEQLAKICSALKEAAAL